MISDCAAGVIDAVVNDLPAEPEEPFVRFIPVTARAFACSCAELKALKYATPIAISAIALNIFFIWTLLVP
jgi:hypothetical protein